DRRISFEMRDKPWKQVIEWFADESGLAFVGSYIPTGTFNFISPRVNGKPKQYTLAEIVDLINDGLLSGPVTQKYILIRGPATFTLLPADERPDPALIPRVTIEDLKSRGKKEMASVVVKLKMLVAEDFVKEAKSMLGPFGDVFALSAANQ